MGSSQSSPVPGGGTEGYHVLRVSELSFLKRKSPNHSIFDGVHLFSLGSRRISWTQSRLRGIF